MAKVMIYTRVTTLISLNRPISIFSVIPDYCWNLSAFRTRGVPGPTSKLSPRAPAQMGRRETEREGGKKPEGDGRER
jgi:hypothetical protein